MVYRIRIYIVIEEGYQIGR
uniref:Uncharacterized protein n=1 Tax=Rhizophora mucronata TaxID=61149 RepID=A0A2P2QAJ5_RHIMU